MSFKLKVGDIVINTNSWINPYEAEVVWIDADGKSSSIGIERYCVKRISGGQSGDGFWHGNTEARFNNNGYKDLRWLYDCDICDNLWKLKTPKKLKVKDLL